MNWVKIRRATGAVMLTVGSVTFLNVVMLGDPDNAVAAAIAANSAAAMLFGFAAVVPWED